MASFSPRRDAQADTPVGLTYHHEDPDRPVYFVNDVEWPVEMEAGAGASVVFSEEPLGGSFTIDLGTQVRRPLLQDANEHVTLSTPTLGRVESLTNDQGGAILSSFQRGGVAPRLAKILERSIWHAPESVRAELRTFTLTGIRQESGTAPSAPFRTEWRAKETLKVDAIFSRPAEAAGNQRKLFFAGVLVSLAASFFVWALELLFGPGRDPIVPLRRRAGQAGSATRR